MSVVLLLTQGAAHAVEYRVVLLGGQSNMDGRGNSTALPAGLQAAQTTVRFYNGNAADTGFTPGNTWTALKPGSLFGPEITFGQSIAAADPISRYALLKHADGGTSLSVHWKAPTPTSPATGPTYSAFKTTVANGLAAITAGGDTYKIVGMLWLQGESDSATAAQYQENLTNFIADVRATYGTNLPFVIGGIGFDDPVGTPAVTAAQAAVAVADPYATYFNNDDLRPSPTALHFNAAGLQTIGRRYTTSLQSVPEPAALCVVIWGAGFWLRRPSRRGPRFARVGDVCRR